MVQKLSLKVELNDQINPNLYQEYDVKRGLRYSDGRGVLVGLTQVGDVVGYEVRDGKKIAVPGKLIYRGYDIEDLIRDTVSHDEFGFEQTAYLLLFGELPTVQQLQEFKTLLGSRRTLPDNFTEDMIMKAPSPDIMNKLARSVLASYSYDSHAEDFSVSNILRQCIELIARFSTFSAYAYQAKRRYYDGRSMYIHNPVPELSTAENFLRLIRSDKHYTKLEAETLDLALILHAEHGGGNNSTFSIHVVSSTDTDTYSAIASAVGSLKGRRHGGANIKVMEMMDNIKENVKDWGNEEEIKAYLRKIVRKEANDHSGLIYGQGHAVYTISDPRAILLKEKAGELAKEKGFMDEYNFYKTIDRLAPLVIQEEKNSDKKICTNVDFYSGFVYSMLNIPRELYTPIFAISRIAGWAAHRMEEVISGGRIYRPAYKNVLPSKEFIPMEDRT
ncbi:MAG: citrate/2-methylcitrate synthase [Candidatus Treponema excrementipullorum]|nr:citrate/2-methylcitrate synthase [Spirochaetia bacterium]MDD7012501.1 citrate/2-methylcitrate synthase [Candidatus Treponema excrementipullorum]MCI7588244.1 citrate/2-methylcitrate synthase [Spirochaetia bacterium]MDY2755288.1 citrate/2-methylcitrate synthase [Candidatus Treponema excrementipullorum]MDY4466511.1 citrate/2-methylcitrate synthase [Candidatus Treponema excrementipullorum]